MANVFNTLPSKEEYMKMIRKNIGIFNKLAKGLKGFENTSGYSFLKSTMHVEMMKRINDAQAVNPRIVYNADFISVLAEQRLIRALEQKGYKVVSGDVQNSQFRTRYIEVLIDWSEK